MGKTERKLSNKGLNRLSVRGDGPAWQVVSDSLSHVTILSRDGVEYTYNLGGNNPDTVEDVVYFFSRGEYGKGFRLLKAYPFTKRGELSRRNAQVNDFNIGDRVEVVGDELVRDSQFIGQKGTVTGMVSVVGTSIFTTWVKLDNYDYSHRFSKTELRLDTPEITPLEVFGQTRFQVDDKVTIVNTDVIYHDLGEEALGELGLTKEDWIHKFQHHYVAPQPGEVMAVADRGRTQLVHVKLESGTNIAIRSDGLKLLPSQSLERVGQRHISKVLIIVPHSKGTGNIDLDKQEHSQDFVAGPIAKQLETLLTDLGIDVVLFLADQSREEIDYNREEGSGSKWRDKINGIADKNSLLIDIHSYEPDDEDFKDYDAVIYRHEGDNGVSDNFYRSLDTDFNIRILDCSGENKTGEKCCDIVQEALEQGIPALTIETNEGINNLDVWVDVIKNGILQLLGKNLLSRRYAYKTEEEIANDVRNMLVSDQLVLLGKMSKLAPKEWEYIISTLYGRLGGKLKDLRIYVPRTNEIAETIGMGKNGDTIAQFISGIPFAFIVLDQSLFKGKSLTEEGKYTLIHEYTHRLLGVDYPDFEKFVKEKISYGEEHGLSKDTIEDEIYTTDPDELSAQMEQMNKMKQDYAKKFYKKTYFSLGVSEKERVKAEILNFFLEDKSYDKETLSVMYDESERYIVSNRLSNRKSNLSDMSWQQYEGTNVGNSGTEEHAPQDYSAHWTPPATVDNMHRNFRYECDTCRQVYSEQTVVGDDKKWSEMRSSYPCPRCGGQLRMQTEGDIEKRYSQKQMPERVRFFLEQNFIHFLVLSDSNIDNLRERGITTTEESLPNTNKRVWTFKDPAGYEKEIYKFLVDKTDDNKIKIIPIEGQGVEIQPLEKFGQTEQDDNKTYTFWFTVYGLTDEEIKTLPLYPGEYEIDEVEDQPGNYDIEIRAQGRYVDNIFEQLEKNDFVEDEGITLQVQDDTDSDKDETYEGWGEIREYLNIVEGIGIKPLEQFGRLSNRRGTKSLGTLKRSYQLASHGIYDDELNDESLGYLEQLVGGLIESYGNTLGLGHLVTQQDGKIIWKDSSLNQLAKIIEKGYKHTGWAKFSVIDEIVDILHKENLSQFISQEARGYGKKWDEENSYNYYFQELENLFRWREQVRKQTAGRLSNRIAQAPVVQPYMPQAPTQKLGKIPLPEEFVENEPEEIPQPIPKYLTKFQGISWAGRNLHLIRVDYDRLDGTRRTMVMEPYSYRTRRPKRLKGGIENYAFLYDQNENTIKGLVKNRIKKVEILPDQFAARWEIEV